MTGSPSASIKLRNIGHRSGFEVVQRYIGAPAAAGEPSQQLEAFAKVTVAAGQRHVVRLDILRDALATWQNASVGWTVVAGIYSIAVDNSSENLPLRGQVRVR